MIEDDIFDEDGALTAAFLISRGYCCGNGCRNCPYTPRHGGLDAVLIEDDAERAELSAGAALRASSMKQDENDRRQHEDNECSDSDELRDLLKDRLPE